MYKNCVNFNIFLHALIETKIGVKVSQISLLHRFVNLHDQTAKPILENFTC